MNNYTIFRYANQSLLRVPQGELQELQLLEDISGFSFAEPGFVYLDSEVDLPKFLHGKLGLPFLSSESTTEHLQIRQSFFAHCREARPEETPQNLVPHSPLTFSNYDYQ